MARWCRAASRVPGRLVGFPHHAGRRGKDYIPLLQDCFESVFPGTRFVGIMPRGGVTAPRANDFYFLIDRDGRVYDLAEMSSGEQAVFPLAYEFVRLDIKRSVVLIDELRIALASARAATDLGGFTEDRAGLPVLDHNALGVSLVRHSQRAGSSLGARDPMPIATLFVEGNLDTQFLNPMHTSGEPCTTAGWREGYSLKPRED